MDYCSHTERTRARTTNTPIGQKRWHKRTRAKTNARAQHTMPHCASRCKRHRRFECSLQPNCTVAQVAWGTVLHYKNHWHRRAIGLRGASRRVEPDTVTGYANGRSSQPSGPIRRSREGAVKLRLNCEPDDLDHPFLALKFPPLCQAAPLSVCCARGPPHPLHQIATLSICCPVEFKCTYTSVP